MLESKYAIERFRRGRAACLRRQALPAMFDTAAGARRIYAIQPHRR